MTGNIVSILISNFSLVIEVWSANKTIPPLFEPDIKVNKFRIKKT